MIDAVKTPLEMFYKWEQETPEKVFLRQPDNGVWTEYTWAQTADAVRRTANFLLSKKYPTGSRIGIWSKNSKDWPIVDLAIMLSGHVSVPLFPGQDVESAKYIFEHSQTKLVFLGETDGQQEVVPQVISGDIESVAMLGCSISCDSTLDSVQQEFEPYPDSPIPNSDDMLTIVYTSGTTGLPKGVVHNHGTPGHVLPGFATAMGFVGTENKLFSFLPMSHVAERVVVEFMGLYTNTPISFSQGLATFADDLRSVQPTLFFAVPRLWLIFKQGIESKFPPEALENADDELKATIATALGLGSARMIMTGAAPCAPDVQNWFLDMGIALRDAYGMTENFIHGSGWLTSDQPIPGCVGQRIDKTVQTRISESGEIQFKSPGLMAGYYLEPEKTAEAFDDGWLRTGDLGRIDDDGNLWITGRASDIFKTAKGKFISPMAIESLFLSSPWLEQCCVFGHGLSQPVLVANLSAAGQALEPAQLQAELDKTLVEINSELASHEQVAIIHITPEWTGAAGLLTPTLKIKRKKIEAKFRAEVETALQASAAGVS